MNAITPPLLRWLRNYNREMLLGDLLAGIIVAIMLVPQGMAYSLLAGLPPRYGLYAAILPLLVYALLGSSRSLAVGPVAIASLMTATTIAPFTTSGEEYAAINAAVHLSLLVGLNMLALRLLRLGSIVNFISHPVIAGFTSAAAVMIILSQLKHLLALDVPRQLHPDQQLWHLLTQLQQTHLPTLLLGMTAMTLLWFSKAHLTSLLQRFTIIRMPLPDWLPALLGRAGPLYAIALTTCAVWLLELAGPVAIVGEIPAGLPELGAIQFEVALLQQLWLPALLIALVGFLESVSVGTALASRRRERVDPNQELIALGSANLAAAVSGTFPVAGGFGRSMVNDSAGAQTTIASLVSALVLMLVVTALTPLFYYLPMATLAAVIIMAVLPLIDLNALVTIWRFNRADGLTLLTTFVLVLMLGVETGILAGIGLSVALLLYRTSQPHIAIVGRVGNSEHFRNEQRHNVNTEQHILAIRIDESLYFANSRYVEDSILQSCSIRPDCRHVVLIFNAVNFLDGSALETLENLVVHLRNRGCTLHLAEVKGPVQDQLARSDLLQHLAPGQIFFTTDEAMKALAPDSAGATRSRR
ncbi:MAG: sulfate permease [Marinobacterium sp.]|nr:sulfate permease [Marinobacterium sp.]